MTKHSFLPNLFQRISCSDKALLPVGDCIQEEIVQLLRHATRSGQIALDSEEEAWSSVLNYGLPMADLANTSRSDVDAVIRHLKRMVPVFEPRIDPPTLKISARNSENQFFRESVLFDISAQAKRMPSLYIAFCIAVDFSNGAIRLVRRPNL